MKFVKSLVVSVLSFSVLAASLPAAPVWAAADSDEAAAVYKEDELVVRWEAGITAEQRQQLLQRMKLRQKDYINNGNYSLAYLEREQSLLALADQLENLKEVRSVEPNYVMKKLYTPADLYFSYQWYLPKLQVPQAWDITRGSGSIVVAVIDGSVQANHPDLQGQIARTYNALSGQTNLPAADEHGTHVAGIIGAAGNQRGTVGIAPQTKLMAINVFDEEDATSSVTVAKAIMYAADNGAKVINMSFGGYEDSDIVNNAVQYAAAKGAVLVAAAGNEHTPLPLYPASFPNVISVSAVGSNDVRMSFSNYGKYIDFAAPGDSILSTIAGSDYELMSGTSMAAPVVSGTAALVLAQNPFLVPSQVYAILQKSAVDLGAPGWDSYYGNGRINAYKAVMSTPAPLSQVSLSAAKLVADGRNTVTISFQPYGAMDAVVFITDAAGKVVRTLFAKPVTSVKTSVAWDGRLADGSYAKAGQYKVYVRIANRLKTITQTADITIEQPPVNMKVSATKLVPKQTKVSVSLQQYSGMTASVIVKDSQGKVVRTLYTKKNGTGTALVSWNGTSAAGSYVRTGTYKIEGRLSDSKRVMTKTAVVQVAAK